MIIYYRIECFIFCLVRHSSAPILCFSRIKMPEEVLDGRHRHKQCRQSNTRLVIQDCHAKFMKSSDPNQSDI